MSMRIAPSERIRQLLEGYLQGGYEQSEQPVSEFVRLAVQLIAQEALEQEVTDFLGRERYERREGPVGYRNGYKPGRMRSAEGAIELAVPQVRDSEQPYQSRLMAFFKGNTDVLDYLVLQMYTRGLSTRDVEEAFRDPLTGRRRLSWRSSSACRPSGMLLIGPRQTSCSRTSSRPMSRSTPRQSRACWMTWKPAWLSCAILPCITGAFAPPTCLSTPSPSNDAAPRPSRASWMSAVV